MEAIREEIKRREKEKRMTVIKRLGELLERTGAASEENIKIIREIEKKIKMKHIDTSALINIILKFYKKDLNFINRLIEEVIFLDLIFYEIGGYSRKYKEIRKIFNNEIKEMIELFNYIMKNLV
jgi:hypothetical protein